MERLIDFCAVAVMQKDEGDVLRAWIDYYTSLFIPGALTIFDNGSTDAETLDQLMRAERLGIRVDRSQNRATDFLAKGDVLMRHFATLGRRYEFLYPCDCDEMLVCGDPADTTRGLAENIRAEFDALRASPASMFRIAYEYRSAPGSPLFSLEGCIHLLLKPPPPAELDNGFHLYDFQNGRDLVPGIEPCGFGQAHFHHKPYDQTLRAARQKLKMHTPTFERKAMRVYTGSGEHLRHFFGMTAEIYQERMSAKASIDLRHWFEKLGVTPPNTGPASLRSNDDERVVFERRPLNGAVYYETSGLGEYTVDLLEPLLWRAKTYLEYAGAGSGAELARAAGATAILTIRSRGIRLGQRDGAEEAGVEERLVLPLPLRGNIMRYADVPPAFRSADAILVAGPYRFAVLCTLYGQMEGSRYRVCVPEFVGWRRQAQTAELFDVQRTFGSAAVLVPKPDCQALATTLFNKHWRDAT